jgi:hypothetical protein
MYWRTPLGAKDFSLFLAGTSGAGKTELASLARQHWGQGLGSRHLPASWESSANSNEALAFYAKDAVLVVDDFAPRGGQFDVQKMHRDADRLLRGQGNRSGRGRMRKSTSLRLAKPPRGLIVSPCEDIPRGVSLRARMLSSNSSRGNSTGLTCRSARATPPGDTPPRWPGSSATWRPVSRKCAAG